MHLTCEPNWIVTSILARCLQEPGFERSLLDDSQNVLRKTGLSEGLRASFARFDFTKLRLFGGLITQTQHNFLWESFPYTRALMKHYQMEVSIFSAYRQEINIKQAGAPSRREKIAGFIAYLKNFLRHNSRMRRYPGLLEITVHESICWELHELTSQQSIKPRGNLLNLPSSAREFDSLVPDFPRNVRSASYKYDPLEICPTLEERAFELSNLKRGRRRLFYQINLVTRELSILESAPVVWQMFQRINGKRRIRSILSATATGRSKQTMRGYFRLAFERGLIQLRSPQ